MRSVKEQSLPLQTPAADAFQTALGVVQAATKVDVVAVHNEGRKLVAFEKSMMSNQKFIVITVDEDPATLHAAVGTDPRTRRAALDGKFNEKSLDKLLDALRSALDGTTPVTTTPMPNHVKQKKTQVEWVDPEQAPEVIPEFSMVAWLAHK